MEEFCTGNLLWYNELHLDLWPFKVKPFVGSTLDTVIYICVVKSIFHNVPIKYCPLTGSEQYTSVLVVDSASPFQRSSEPVRIAADFGLIYRVSCSFVCGFVPGSYFNMFISTSTASFPIWKPSFLDLPFSSLCSLVFHHTFWQPDPITLLSNTPSPLPLSIPPSSHEFIMWSKIEQWLFVPVPACHWSRMNNSAIMVEVGIWGNEEIILELYYSGYFRTASCQCFFLQRSLFPLPLFFLTLVSPTSSLTSTWRMNRFFSVLLVL